ncbi:mannosyltransferase family protein [uncultured Propionibacterium sp.]|uniref:mannosyltransferase family protein n=1 Tax=uncultured Propionibacterium sp. TaxID=218066 RepID=UPI00292F9F5C|nr:mannosyltransferase family protein [uncultured Propionibacterium sp.]
MTAAPVPDAGARARNPGALRWRDDLRVAVVWWALSRVFFMALALVLDATGRAVRPTTGGPWPGNAFMRFDAGHLLRITADGYFTPDDGVNAYDEAFFPGYPLASRAVARLVGLGRLDMSTAVAGATIVTWLAALGAGALLVRIAREHLRISPHAVAAAYLLGPYAVFLMAPYTEALFGLCALAAWYLGEHRHWRWAIASATLACTVRVNGLFIVVMLMVMMVTGPAGGRRPGRDRRRLLALGIPVCAPLAYFAYLWARTGDVFYWMTAQKLGWGRGSAWFGRVLVDSARHIGDAETSAVAWQQGLEFVFLIVFCAAGWWCLHRGRAEWAVLVWLTLYSLCRGPVLLSLPRNGLDCFPVVLAMGAALTGARGWRRGVLAVAGIAVAVVNTSTFLADQWTG